MNPIYAIVGPSGSGKTFASKLLKKSYGDRLHVAVSDSTRPKRPGEREGVDYHFVDDETFDRNLAEGRYVEHTAFAGARYALRKDEIETGLPTVVVIEPEGLGRLAELYGENVQCLYLDAPEKIRYERMAALRGDDDARRRMGKDDIETRWFETVSKVPLRITGIFCGPDAAWEAFVVIARDVALHVDPVNPNPKMWRVHPVTEDEESECRIAHWSEAPSFWTLYVVDEKGMEHAIEDFDSECEALLAIPRFDRCEGCVYLTQKEGRSLCEPSGRRLADIIACPEA